MIGIILTRRDFREYDQMITVYTKDHGKRDFLARGVKKITSKNSPHLEPFSLVEIDCVQGKEFSVLTKVVSYNFFKTIRVDLIKSATASYIVGVLNRVVVGVEEDKAIFDLLLSLLLFLEKNNSSPSTSIAGFLMKLLSKLGLEPVLTHCVIDPAHSLEKDLNRFNFRAGGVVCSICQVRTLSTKEPGIFLSTSQITLLQKLLHAPWEDIKEVVVEKKVMELIYTFFTIHNERAIPRPLEMILK